MSRGGGLLRELELLWRLQRRATRGRPERVTAILTERCHLRCAFCRLWEDPDPGATGEEWLAFFGKNPFLRWVNLSGGELFAKEHLASLLDGIVAALPRLALLNFPTAGQKPGQAEAAVQRLLATRLPRLVVTVSLDGGPALHDELRGVPGAFERGLETYRRLRALTGRRFAVRVGCTLTDRAQEQEVTLREELHRRLPDFRATELHFNLAHHSGHYYRNTGYAGLPRTAALDVLERQPFAADAAGCMDWLYRRLARRALEDGFPPMGCTAIHHTVFVGADLTVYPCSVWSRPLGNLRDSDYRLEPLLHGTRAREARQTIDRRACPGCFTPCETTPAFLARPWRSAALALAPGRGSAEDGP